MLVLGQAMVGSDGGRARNAAAMLARPGKPILASHIARIHHGENVCHIPHCLSCEKVGRRVSVAKLLVGIATRGTVLHAYYNFYKL